MERTQKRGQARPNDVKPDANYYSSTGAQGVLMKGNQKEFLPIRSYYEPIVKLWYFAILHTRMPEILEDYIDVVLLYRITGT